MLASYTYAHSLDISSSFENADVSGTSLGTNPFNPREDYADSLFDVRHRLVTSFTYEIPNFSHVRGLGFVPDRFSQWLENYRNRYPANRTASSDQGQRIHFPDL